MKPFAGFAPLVSVKSVVAVRLSLDTLVLMVLTTLGPFMRISVAPLLVSRTAMASKPFPLRG